MRLRNPNTQRQGFTLIELSIVLVIIGLIVGGVLVGQDLIKAAALRATVTQAEKYKTAVNTFRLEYGGLPGDILASTAGAFGLFRETTLGGAVGHGDGNGRIEGGGAGSTAGIGETLTFWRQLSDSHLIDGAYGISGNSAILPTLGEVTAEVTSATITQSLPGSKINANDVFAVFSGSVQFFPSGSNYLQLMPIATIPTAGTYTYGNNGLTPLEAYNIDVKMDDGTPIGGQVHAAAMNIFGGLPSGWLASQANTCTCCLLVPGTESRYNMIPASGGNDRSCAMIFQF